jgi:hypothetical protein
MSLEIYTSTGLVKDTATSDADDTVKSLTEATHGFNPADLVHHNGSNWVLADANNSLPCHAVVLTTPDASTFTAAVAGWHTISSHGYTLGQNYLSDTAGAATTTLPGPGSIQQNVLVAYTADDFFIHIGEGVT